jgi:hypothetical protein
MDRRKKVEGRRKGARVLVYLTLVLLSSSFFLLAQEKPLPEFDVIYKTARENLARAQRSTHLYAFKERRTDLHTNVFGRLGTGGVRLSEVYPSPTARLTYRRVIERNGMPVSAAELAQQDRAYRERVAEAQRRPRAEEPGTARQRGERMIADVVDTLQFTSAGRAMRDGVQTIVVSFTPKPTARPVTREGRIAQKFAGTVWMQESNFEVMRVEAKAVDDLSFGYGLVARLGEGTPALMVRKPVADGIWMPTELRLNGRGRAAFGLRRLVIDYVVEWFDYRRLPFESAAPFLDPRIQSQTGGRPQ